MLVMKYRWSEIKHHFLDGILYSNETVPSCTPGDSKLKGFMERPLSWGFCLKIINWDMFFGDFMFYENAFR